MIPPNTPPVIIIYFGLFNLHYSIVVLECVVVEGLCPAFLLADAGDLDNYINLHGNC